MLRDNPRTPPNLPPPPANYAAFEERLDNCSRVLTGEVDQIIYFANRYGVHTVEPTTDAHGVRKEESSNTFNRLADILMRLEYATMRLHEVNEALSEREGTVSVKANLGSDPYPSSFSTTAAAQQVR